MVGGVEEPRVIRAENDYEETSYIRLRDGVGGHRGRVVADRPRGAVTGRQITPAQGGWRFFKVGVEKAVLFVVSKTRIGR